MKRAFLKKVKPISCSSYSPNSSSSNAEAGEPEQTQSGARRRMRTSAAMVGLALSMGTAGLIVPRHGDGASAAESNENSASTLQSAPQVATLAPNLHGLITTPPPALSPAPEAFEHVVLQGQTLQQVAQRYRVSIEALASVNRILPTDLLKPGQVLRVPAGASTGGAMQSPQISALAELSRLPAPDLAAQAQARDQALGRLMQEQSKLKARLTELRRQDGSVQVAQRAGDTSNKQVQSPLPSPANSQSVPQAVALTPSPAVSPSPDLDWMQVNQSLSISPGAQAGTLSPSPALSQPQAKPVVTAGQPISGQLVPGQGAQIQGTQIQGAQITTAMGLGVTPEQSYEVSLGDTVARIARTHNVPQAALISANRLSDPNVIFVGQMLKVPTTQVDSSPALPTVLPASQAVKISGAALPAVPIQVRQSQMQQSQPAQLAVVPSTIPSSIPATALDLSAAGNQAAVQRPYVQNLLSEVKALREQRLVQASVRPESQPDRQPDRQAVSVASPIPSSRSVAPVSRPTVPRAQRQQVPAVVAVAPLNPESYAPLTEQIPGRLVSPDLPALPGAEHFLPDGKLTGYLWPAKGVLTSGYGWRWGRMHSGIDIASDVGTPIYAAASGVVQYAGWNSGGYGNMVEIKHADGSMTRYGHMNAIHVQEGQRVSQSEPIGEMGSTGYSTGPHLHFEVHPVASSGAVNPMAYLPAQ